MLTEGAVTEQDGEDGWVIAEARGGDQIEDIDGNKEEKKEEEEEVIGDIDDEDEDENIFVKKQEDVGDQVT